jgi:glyoxylase-like metal-dependent hydrolase (beta-lactamase superfamily II)
VWHWTAVHPTWYEHEVESYAWDAGTTLVLLDPLSPPSEVDELAGGKGVAIVLTCDWHDRSAPELVERLGATLHAPAGGDGGLEAQHFERGATLPGGIVAHGATHPGEVTLWIADAGALVVGDALITRDGRLEIPERWLPKGDSLEGVRARLAPLLELPVELVLTTHGDPVPELGAEALQAALALPPGR